ncbi:FG-GAP-like repeat-containing protein [Streptomyces sp. 135]|uniref:FG-GAP-like repeat-containing protein n=1 Tax=Streptomyces sp. 135 TaxID=2838850 RepID=UPI001CBB4A89|nr:FG-GAP-like repeat-containing protein [Streptomyces sp. 135]
MWAVRRGPAAALVLVLACGMAVVGVASPAAATAKATGSHTDAGADAWTTTWASPMDSLASQPNGAWTGEGSDPDLVPEAAGATHVKVTGQQTVRMPVHASIGGGRARIRLDNRTNTVAVHLGHATIAPQSSGAQAATAPVTLTFGGKQDVTLAAGQELASDPVDFPVRADQTLLVSLYLPDPVTYLPYHHYTLTTLYSSGTTEGAIDGTDRAGDTDATHFTQRSSGTGYAPRVLLSGLEVTPSSGGGTVVALGDSQTDGGHTAADVNARWLDVYGRALQTSAHPMGVANEGISGNRVLTDNTASQLSMLHRFQHDVLDVPGVQQVLFYGGINDITKCTSSSTEAPCPGLEAQLEAAVTTMAAKAHAAGLTFTVATLPAFANHTSTNKYWDPSGWREKVRLKFNAFLRTTSVADAVADFDTASYDPATPTAHTPDTATGLLPAGQDRVYSRYVDHSDWLHLNDDGNWAVAQSLPATAQTTRHDPAKSTAATYTQTSSADINGDGIGDILAVDENTHALYYWPGMADSNTSSNTSDADYAEDVPRGDGTFGGKQKITTGWGFTQTSTADLNGDGVQDILAVDADHVLWWWPGTGTLPTRNTNNTVVFSSAFTAKQEITGNWRFTQTSTADLNGDGVQDILAVDADHVLWWWPGTGTLPARNTNNTVVFSSAFTAKQEITGNWRFTQTSTADLNGDGVQDILAVDADHVLWWWPGTGTLPARNTNNTVVFSSAFSTKRQLATDWSSTQTTLGPLRGTTPQGQRLLARDANGNLNQWTPLPATGQNTPGPQRRITPHW